MLLEHLLEFDIKRRALELQHKLLEHPYGEHMHVELEAMPWQDAFDGSNVKLGPAVMDKPTIVLKVNDQFDGQRQDPYGPDGIRVVMTQDSIFITMHADEPEKFVQYDGKGSLKDEYFDQAIVNRVMKHFIVMPSSSRDAFFDIKEADAGVNGDLTFMVNHADPAFYRHKQGLTAKEVEVGQLLLIRANGANVATLLKLDSIVAGELTFDSMKAAFEHFGTNSLIGLLKTTTRTDRVALACKDVGTNANANVYMKPRGASATWVYDMEPCSLALMERV